MLMKSTISVKFMYHWPDALFRRYPLCMCAKQCPQKLINGPKSSQINIYTIQNYNSLSVIWKGSYIDWSVWVKNPDWYLLLLLLLLPLLLLLLSSEQTLGDSRLFNRGVLPRSTSWMPTRYFMFVCIKVKIRDGERKRIQFDVTS